MHIEVNGGMHVVLAPGPGQAVGAAPLRLQEVPLEPYGGIGQHAAGGGGPPPVPADAKHEGMPSTHGLFAMDEFREVMEPPAFFDEAALIPAIHVPSPIASEV